MTGHQPTDRIDLDNGSLDPLGLLFVGDVRALQRAETVTFHTGDAGSWIDAGLSAPGIGQIRVYTAVEQRLFPDADTLDRRRRIVVDGHICGFDDQLRWHERHLPGTAAFTSVQAARLDEVWRSIAAILRVGDIVRLHWRAGNTCDGIVDPDLHRDELHVAIRRGRRRWTFLLDVQVRPEPARMITRTSA